MHDDKITSQNLSTSSRNISTWNNSLKTWVKSRRSTGSARNHKSYSVVWTKQRSLNFARILHNSNVLIAIPLRKSGSFIAVAGEIWNTSGVLQEPRRLIATILQSLALSLIWIPVEDQSTAHLNDRSCSSERRRCLRKQDSQSTAAIQRFSPDGMHKKDTEGHWRSTILAKKKSCFTIASILKYMTIQLHELTGYRTPNIGLHVWMLMGPRNLFDSDQKLSMHQNNAWKCKMITWRKRNKLWYRYVHNMNNVNEKISNSKEEKTSITMSMTKLDGGTTESHGETRRQHLHLQLRSGHFHNGERAWQPTSSQKWWWFRLLGKNSRESTRGLDRSPTHNTHLCSTVCSQARNASHALGSSHTDCSVIFVRLKRICHLVCTSLIPVGWLTCRSPRAHQLPHSLFLVPRHKNTQHNNFERHSSRRQCHLVESSSVTMKGRTSCKGRIENYICTLLDEDGRACGQRWPTARALAAHQRHTQGERMENQREWQVWWSQISVSGADRLMPVLRQHPNNRAAAERHNRCVVDAGRFHHPVIDIPPDTICLRCDLISNDTAEL